jgi:hypothetical protein
MFTKLLNAIKSIGSTKEVENKYAPDNHVVEFVWHVKPGYSPTTTIYKAVKNFNRENRGNAISLNSVKAIDIERKLGDRNTGDNFTMHCDMSGSIASIRKFVYVKARNSIVTIDRKALTTKL